MLKEELWGCFKYVGIPFDMLDKMPVRDRKYYINKHNKKAIEDEERMNKENNGSSMSLDRYTDMSQGKMG